jgi:formylglycine-generating enzyme required for sulfatase activity
MPVSFNNEANAGKTHEIPISRKESLTLSWCPPGHFEMGSPASDNLADTIEKPRHSVPIAKGYAMSIYPISVAQWIAIMDVDRLTQDLNPALPIEGMRWEEAVSFCERLTKLLQSNGQLSEKQSILLPMEFEWEYACRAGTLTRWFFGENSERLAEYAWYASNSDGHTHPVGQKRANPWGLYDLYGNVEEWCLDGFVAYRENSASQAALVPTPNARITRGGSYQSSVKVCSSSSRTVMEINNPYNEPVGFRVVLKTED